MASRVRDKRFFLGLGVLVIGIILLAFTFWQAYMLLGEVDPAMFEEMFRSAGTEGLESVVSEAVSLLVYVALRVTYLGIMAWVGSLISQRGVQLIVAKSPET